MKIGFLLSSFYPSTGGREVITFNLAKELAKRGHEIHIFTTLKDNWKEEETFQGLNIHRTKTICRYRYYLELNPGWIKNIMRYNLDILHIQSFGFIIADIAVLLKKLSSKTKIVNTPHGPFMALEKYPWWQSALKKIYTLIEWPINRMYDAVIAVNPEQWKWMTKAGVKKEKICFIPNSIPKEVFKKVNVSSFEKKHNLKGKFVISYLGRIQKYKGLDQVIRIMPDLLKVNKNLVFLAMGKDAGDKARLLRLAKELNVENNVIIADVDDKSKLQGLEISEIFVLPSEWEAFGIVLIEAMARKNALVSTKTEGGKFLIKNGVEGYLYDYKDTEQLKRKLLKIITNSKLRKKMQMHNYKKAQEFLTEKIVTQLEALYQSLLEQKCRH